MSRSTVSTSTLITGFVLFAAMLVATDPALAQVTVRDMSANVGTQVRRSTVLIPTLCYVIGVFFAASGLLKLKDWINEGDKIGIMPAIMRLSVSALLIFMPHMLILMTNTMFGKGTTENGVDIDIDSPALGAFQKSK